MRSTVLVVILSLVGRLTFALGYTSSGGGAGCPTSDGSIITLLECGAPYQEPGDVVSHYPGPTAPSLISQVSQIPEGMNELIQYIRNFKYFSAQEKQTLIHAIQPTAYRKYFYVDSAPDLTLPIVNRIKTEFQRTTGLRPSQLILYGVTDTRAQIPNSSYTAQITYLLPAFHRLKTMEEKMTALVHENYWVLFPNATYEQVVHAEIVFEAAMQKPTALRMAEYVKSYFGVTPRAMQLYLLHDLQNGNLAGLFDGDGRTSSYALFGGDFLNCHADDDYTCKTMSKNHLEKMALDHDKSQFLAELYKIQTAKTDVVALNDNVSYNLLIFVPIPDRSLETFEVNNDSGPSVFFWSSVLDLRKYILLTDYLKWGGAHTVRAWKFASSQNQTIQAVTDGSDSFPLR